MNISKTDIKIILLWSVIAYVAGSILGNIFFDYISGSFVALGIYLIPYSIIYGFCGFKAVGSLKGRTKLSWIKIVLFMIVIIYLFGVAWRILFLLVGSIPPGSGNLFGHIAIILGGYISYKELFRKK